ncbi:MAG: hypothetical protein CL938_14965 [Deltaproteobacteria bacterium]|nr:hypothetical protein [Deltaproteobacteria bacterium]
MWCCRDPGLRAYLAWVHVITSYFFLTDRKASRDYLARVWGDPCGRRIQVPFLGDPVEFPQAPFLLAHPAANRCP